MSDKVLTTLCGSGWRSALWTREPLPLFTCHAMSDEILTKLRKITSEVYKGVPPSTASTMSDKVLTRLHRWRWKSGLDKSGLEKHGGIFHCLHAMRCPTNFDQARHNHMRSPTVCLEGASGASLFTSRAMSNKVLTALEDSRTRGRRGSLFHCLLAMRRPTNLCSSSHDYRTLEVRKSVLKGPVGSLCLPPMRCPTNF